MSSESLRPFNRRSFVTLTVALTGLGLPPSGYMVHLFQDGPMSVARHAWMAAHTALGILFLGFSIAHFWLNRRAFLSYLKNRLRLLPGPSREFWAALFLVSVLLFFAVGHAFVLP